jgi:hypothetical protein
MGILQNFYRRRLKVEWERFRLFEKNKDPFRSIEWVSNSYYFPSLPRHYHFQQASTYVIIWEIILKKERRQPNRLYKLTFCLFSKPFSKSARKLLDEQCRELMIRSGERSPSVSMKWGQEYVADWKPGDYEVQLLLNGVDVVKTWFTIGPAPPPPPPKPAAEVLY